MVAGVPQVEVVTVDAHADEVLRARLAVQTHQGLGVEAFGLPQRDGVLVSELRRVPVSLQMILVLAAALHVHVAGVPVARADRRRRSPMRPDAELGIAEPRWTGVGMERIAGGLKRSFGNLHVDRRLRAALEWRSAGRAQQAQRSPS